MPIPALTKPWGPVSAVIACVLTRTRLVELTRTRSVLRTYATALYRASGGGGGGGSAEQLQYQGIFRISLATTRKSYYYVVRHLGHNRTTTQIINKHGVDTQETKPLHNHGKVFEPEYCITIRRKIPSDLLFVQLRPPFRSVTYFKQYLLRQMTLLLAQHPNSHKIS